MKMEYIVDMGHTKGQHTIKTTTQEAPNPLSAWNDQAISSWQWENDSLLIPTSWN